MKKSTDTSFLFGPVPSRRFGRSLGVDLLPFKTCTLACPFCEVGATTNLTVERREYVPVNAALLELDAWFRAGGETDFITAAGSGEPTLNTRFGDILDYARTRPGLRSALLTNSTLLHLPEVRKGAARADVVKATLSAWDQASFERMHKPHSAVTFKQVLDGLLALRDEFAGNLWLEVFLVPGVNSGEDDVRRIADLAAAIRPDLVQLNTAVRPTARPGIMPLSPEIMAERALLFTPEAEVAATFKGAPGARAPADIETILAMIRRRPCSASDISKVFSLEAADAARLLDDHVGRGVLQVERDRAGAHYFYGARPTAGKTAPAEGPA